MMNKILNILMLSCKKATALIDKKLSFKLSPSESVRLVMHKSMCDACTAYEKQSRIIDNILSSGTVHHHHTEPSSDFKQKLFEKIKK